MVISMKNKKGFAFVETIIVLTVVTLSLTMLLSTYSLLARKTKEKENYDKASDKYLLNSILNLGTNNVYNYESLLKANGDLKITPENCNESENEKLMIKVGDKKEHFIFNVFGENNSSGENVCSKIFDELSIVSLYLIADVNEALKDDQATKKYDNGTIEYIKTLKKCNDEKRYVNEVKKDEHGNQIGNPVVKDIDDIINNAGKCMVPVNYFVGVFYRNDQYYFASIPLGTNTASIIDNSN